LRFGPLPNINNPSEVEVNPIRPASPSYATSRLGIAVIDYLSNTDFHCNNYLVVAAREYHSIGACDPTKIDGTEIVNSKIITPILPIMTPGYPSTLFLAISDIPHNPAPIISSTVISSYIVMKYQKF